MYHEKTAKLTAQKADLEVTFTETKSALSRMEKTEFMQAMITEVQEQEITIKREIKDIEMAITKLRVRSWAVETIYKTETFE